MREEFMTVVEAAQKLGASPRTIQRYCKQGRLNFRWIKGIRHKELRILPPILISQLPGGRKRALSSTFDYVTKAEFEEIIAGLKQKLEEKDHRIALLEVESTHLKTLLEKSGPFPLSTSDTGAHASKLKAAIESFLYEQERIRPSERKLIIKIAKELDNLKNYLKSLAANSRNDSPQSF